MANFEKIVAYSFKWEGGYSAYSNDSASWCNGQLIGTNRGISAIAYKGYYKRCPTVAELKALTTDQAKTIYKSLFWDKLQLDYVLNDSVAQLMFQYIIGSGQSQISDLKNIANETAGKILFAVNDTPFTKSQALTINTLNQKAYWDNLKAWRLAFFDRIVAANPSLGIYLVGWKRRTNSFVFEGFDKKKMIIYSAGISLLTFSILHFGFKQYDMKQKIIVSLSVGVISFFGFQIYNNYKK